MPRNIQRNILDGHDLNLLTAVCGVLPFQSRRDWGAQVAADRTIGRIADHDAADCFENWFNRPCFRKFIHSGRPRLCISKDTYRIQNTDIPLAVRGVAAHGGAPGRGGAGRDAD